MTQLVNPEKIIIRGPITMLGDKLTTHLKLNLYKYCFPLTVDNTKIVCFTTNEYAAMFDPCIAIREKLILPVE